MTRRVATAPLLLLVGSGVALVWALLPRSDPAEDVGGGMAGFRIPVTVRAVERGRVTERVSLVGDVVTSRRAELAFERSGRVAEVLVDLGDIVAGGAILARLEDTVLERELAVATAGTEEARVNAEVAEREAARVRETGGDLVSESVLDQRESDAAAARHRLAQAQAVAARIGAQLEQGRLRAPFDGVVTRRFVTDGTFAAIGREAFELVDLERRVAHIEIPPPVAAALDDGVEVTLSVDELPGLSVLAQLDRVVPAADPGTRTFLGLIHLGERDPERRLLPGMFVRASIVRRDALDALVVPTDAVLRRPEGASVVMLAPGDDGPTAVFVPVTISASTVDRTAVVPVAGATLSVGAQVVLTGVDNVFPGAPLTPLQRAGRTSPGVSSPAGSASAAASGGASGDV